MASTDVALNQGTDSRQDREPVVNNFSIQVATVNGSGSQSANSVLMRTIFQMGVPVSSKNLFPSNIAGLPTWFTIRVSKDGYVARKRDSELLIAMNPETAADDIHALKPGAVVLFDEPLKLEALRDDLVFYSVPFDKLVAPVAPEPKLKKLLRNMIYVGVDGAPALAGDGRGGRGDRQAVPRKKARHRGERGRRARRIRVRQRQSLRARASRLSA